MDHHKTPQHHNQQHHNQQHHNQRATLDNQREDVDGETVGAGATKPTDRGQATTEYALVLLAAALVGVLVIGWATSGGGAAAINRLFDAVMDAVIGNI